MGYDVTYLTTHDLTSTSVTIVFVHFPIKNESVVHIQTPTRNHLRHDAVLQVCPEHSQVLSQSLLRRLRLIG